MLFQLPSEDDPLPKRFYMMMILFIDFFIEFMLPAVAAIFLLGMIVMICGNMLGLIPSETTNRQTQPAGEGDQTDSADPADPDPVQAVDEKTLLEIETRILEEMVRTRRARLDELVESEDDGSWIARVSRLGKRLWQILNTPLVAQFAGGVITVLVFWFSTQAS